MTKGEIIAGLIALAFNGECGPFGGEDPYLDGNQVGLHSQMGTSYYFFSDEGGVDIDFDDDAIKNLGIEMGELSENFTIRAHWDSILDLLDSDDGWFMEFTYDHPKIVEAIKAVLAI